VRIAVVLILRAYQALLMALVAAIVVIVAVAVFFRYVLNAPLVFSFDLATVLFVWLIFLGLAQAAHEGAHLAVDLLPMVLPAPAARILDVAMRLIMIAIAIFLVRHSYDLATRTRMEIASMRISMMWVYMAAPVGFGIFALYEVTALVMMALNRPLPRQAA
jgi:TRAP-type transport system small permease protein